MVVTIVAVAVVTVVVVVFKDASPPPTFMFKRDVRRAHLRTRAFEYILISACVHMCVRLSVRVRASAHSSVTRSLVYACVWVAGRHVDVVLNGLDRTAGRFTYLNIELGGPRAAIGACAFGFVGTRGAVGFVGTRDRVRIVEIIFR